MFITHIRYRDTNYFGFQFEAKHFTDGCTAFVLYLVSGNGNDMEFEFYNSSIDRSIGKKILLELGGIGVEHCIYDIFQLQAFCQSHYSHSYKGIINLCGYIEDMGIMGYKTQTFKCMIARDIDYELFKMLTFQESKSKRGRKVRGICGISVDTDKTYMSLLDYLKDSTTVQLTCQSDSFPVQRITITDMEKFKSLKAQNDEFIKHARARGYKYKVYGANPNIIYENY